MAFASIPQTTAIWMVIGGNKQSINHAAIFCIKLL